MIRLFRGPRSLLWRLGALALAVTLVSLILHVTVMSFWFRPVADDLIGQLASRVLVTRDLIHATPEADRDKVALRLKDSKFEVSRGEVGGPEMQAMPPAFDHLLERRLGADFQLFHETKPASSSETHKMWIGFKVDQRPWRVRVLAVGPVGVVLGTGIGWLALAAAAVAASFLIGLRFIVGPIRHVAQRIADQGAELSPVAAPPGTSAELLSLIESFNKLVERVRAADRTKQLLLAGVSHDLRTPLSRLRLRIETQCEPNVAEAAEEELVAVEHIVSQFLAFVHGNSDSSTGPCASVMATVDQLVASQTARGTNIAFLKRAPDAQMSTVAMQRLLSNLIDNALSHGSLPIEVSWREPAPGMRELAVWDGGPGLSPAQFDAALEPFVRMSNSVQLGHCGLGLAIVAQIAHQWQATLACRHDEVGRFGVLVTWRVVDAVGAA